MTRCAERLVPWNGPGVCVDVTVDIEEHRHAEHAAVERLPHVRGRRGGQQAGDVAAIDGVEPTRRSRLPSPSGSTVTISRT